MSDLRKNENASNGEPMTSDEELVERLLTEMPQRKCPSDIRQRVMAVLREEADAESPGRESGGARVLSLWFRKRSARVLQVAAVLLFAVVGADVYFNLKKRGELPKPAEVKHNEEVSTDFLPPTTDLVPSKAGDLRRDAKVNYERHSSETAPTTERILEEKAWGLREVMKKESSVEDSNGAQDVIALNGVLPAAPRPDDEKLRLGTDAVGQNVDGDGVSIQAGGERSAPALPERESVRRGRGEEDDLAVLKAVGGTGRSGSGPVEPSDLPSVATVDADRDSLKTDGGSAVQGRLAQDEGEASLLERDQTGLGLGPQRGVEGGEMRSPTNVPPERSLSLGRPTAENRTGVSVDAGHGIQMRPAEPAPAGTPASSGVPASGPLPPPVISGKTETAQPKGIARSYEYAEDLGASSPEALDSGLKSKDGRGTRFAVAQKPEAEPGGSPATWSRVADQTLGSFNRVVGRYGGIIARSHEIVLQPSKRRAFLVECSIPETNGDAFFKAVNNKRLDVASPGSGRLRTRGAIVRGVSQNSTEPAKGLNRFDKYLMDEETTPSKAAFGRTGGGSWYFVRSVPEESKSTFGESDSPQRLNERLEAPTSSPRGGMAAVRQVQRRASGPTTSAALVPGVELTTDSLGKTGPAGVAGINRAERLRQFVFILEPDGAPVQPAAPAAVEAP